MDRVLELAADHRRRHILSLLRRGEPVTESGLAVRGAPDGSDHSIELHHVHLPMLAEAGYIEWDRDTGEIGTGPQFEEVEPLVELLENRSVERTLNWP